MTTAYYVKRRLKDGVPIAIYRFFDDRQRAPETITPKGLTWRVGQALWAARASGELDEADRVDAAEADRIVAGWVAGASP